MKEESTNHDRDNEVKGDSPSQQAYLNSYINLSKNIGLNTHIYYMDNLTNSDIPNYTTLD